jgi:hypothetical protein
MSQLDTEPPRERSASRHHRNLLVINRAAIMLRYREPAMRWIHAADPHDDDPGMSQEVVNQERTISLIRAEDGETSAAVAAWIERHDRHLFEAELQGWYTDPAFWPQELTLQLWRAWFDGECHSVLNATVGGRIYDEHC